MATRKTLDHYDEEANTLFSLHYCTDVTAASNKDRATKLAAKRQYKVGLWLEHTVTVCR